MNKFKIKLKTIILLITVICLTPVCYGAKWFKVKEKLYIDTSSLQYYNNGIYQYNNNSRKFSFWEKQLNDKSNYFNYLERTYGKKIWYSMSKQLIDCNNKLISIKATHYYDLNRNVIKSDEYSDYNLRWVDIPPETLGEYYYNWVCQPR